MEVVLINSPVEAIVEEYDAPPYPHIGLAYLATYAIRKGISCKVIDCKFQRLNLHELMEIISKFDVTRIIFGFTAKTHEISRVMHTAEEIKKRMPKSIIILGGIHITALPEQTLEEFKVIDVGVVGEGEYSFVQLIECLHAGKPLDEIDGVVYRENGTIVHNPKTKWIHNLDEIGYPDWSLFPKGKEYPINIGRGCPVPCIFCMRASGTESRFRSADNIIEELTMLKEQFQPRMIHFFGDDFCSNTVLTNELLDRMINANLNLRWRAGMRVSKIDIRILEKMKAAGCEHIEIGVESGNKEVLRSIKKGISLDKVQEVVLMAKKVKLDCWCYFILGHPNETWQTAMDTVNFLCKINPTNAAVGIMVPYPGTQIWEMANKGEGGYRLLSTDWQDFNKQIGNALELESLSRRQLEFLQIYGYIKLFIVNFRFFDFIKFCWRYKKEGWEFSKNFVSKIFKTRLNI